MRTLPMLLLAGVLAGACSDPSGPPSGSLLVSTSTTGADPDEDGYELVVDGEPVLTLFADGTEELTLDGGDHTLDLRGVDPHCTVEPAVPFEVRVAGDRVPVDLTVDCPPTGVIVTVRYTGIDIPAFHRVAVDGVAASSVVTSAPSTLTRLGPGERTVELLAGPGNCTPEGPASKTVTVIPGAFVPVDFAVRCTASTGVLKVMVTAEGEDVGFSYRLVVDGTLRSFQLPEPYHLTGVTGGQHTVVLETPSNCVVQEGTRSVTVDVGGAARDTVEIGFEVTCVRFVATLRVVTTTSGTQPDVETYEVYLWEGDYYYYPSFSGAVGRSDVLEITVGPGIYRITLVQPEGCTRTPAAVQFTVAHGQVLELPFEVACAP